MRPDAIQQCAAAIVAKYEKPVRVAVRPSSLRSEEDTCNPWDVVLVYDRREVRMEFDGYSDAKDTTKLISAAWDIHSSIPVASL